MKIEAIGFWIGQILKLIALLDKYQNLFVVNLVKLHLTVLTPLDEENW